MSIPIRQVDAFTDAPFSGNPAAVCMLPEPRASQWMQAVATEMNLSETAFLVARADGAWDLRWFTPALEVDLCGHATLASAHVLWEDGYLAADAAARFRTRSGLLTARLGDDDEIWLDFPSRAPDPAEPPPELLTALGIATFDVSAGGPTTLTGGRAIYVGRNREDWLVQVESPFEVEALSPDMEHLARIECRGVIVTAASADEGVDFVSRFFGPRVGVPEDPVTGSAHCCLAPFWAELLGRSELVGWQASRRGGRVRVLAQGERVLLGGRAVTVLRGDLLA